MTEILTWQIIVFLAGMIAAWSLVVIATLRWMLGRYFSQYDEQFLRQRENNQILRENFLELKADLPLNYVRKEDFIRHEVVINTKLDRLRDLIESTKEKKND